MWYIILTLLTAIYLFINLVLPGTVGGFLETYVIRPILWISLAVLVFLIAKKEGINIWRFKKVRKWEIGKTPFQAALLFGGFQVSILILAGLLFGFGNSPYSHSIYGILTNTIFFVSALFGMEITRSYLIKKGTSARKRNITMILLLVSILFMVISMTPSGLINITSGEPAATAKFFGQGIIPLLAMSLFASYLAYLGGALPAIAYMGIIQAFDWYSPIIPNLDWALVGLVGTIGPAIGFMIIQTSVQTTRDRKIKLRKTKKDPGISWAVVAILSLFIIFFSFGYLGPQPSVISTGSMSPTIEIGDVVLVSDVEINDIKVGDIIQYNIGNKSIPIVHRVHEIYEEEDSLLFITKGDANSAPDIGPVSPEQIMGKVVFTIPKIGWISLGINELFNKIGIQI